MPDYIRHTVPGRHRRMLERLWSMTNIAMRIFLAPYQRGVNKNVVILGKVYLYAGNFTKAAEIHSD